MGALWHPNAVRRIHIDSGPHQSGNPKIVWHTTEVPVLPNYGGTAPHFTLDPRDGRLWQHIPLNRGARTLVAGGPNFMHAIQVELIGNAKDTQDWTDLNYRRIAKLARWIEANFNVPRKTTVTFMGDVNPRPHLPSIEAFRLYSGHIGHQHVPGNTHWDPGKFKIQKVLHPQT